MPCNKYSTPTLFQIKIKQPSPTDKKFYIFIYNFIFLFFQNKIDLPERCNRFCVTIDVDSQQTLPSR